MAHRNRWFNSPIEHIVIFEGKPTKRCQKVNLHPFLAGIYFSIFFGMTESWEIKLYKFLNGRWLP
jgi:hypothetical protein